MSFARVLSPRHQVLWLAAVLMSCSAYDPDLIGRYDATTDARSDAQQPDGSDDDATVADASRMDTSIGDAAGCMPSGESSCPMMCPETCNGRDDDCDTEVDEGNDNELCSLTNAEAVCVQATCLVVACLNGAADCDTLPGNGCEASLDTPQHCGLCHAACRITNATVLCVNAACTLDACVPGYGNCDGNADNGCELRLNSLVNCGGCAVACPSVENGQPACLDGACGIAACDMGFEDCDGDPSNGCEVSLDTLTSCGSCTTTCDYDHAQPLCAAQSCVPGSCLDGFGDCDGEPSNECEVAFNTDVNNCGACGRACDPTGTGGMYQCTGGQCFVSACPSGLADCDSSASNGCETSLRTLTDCGACNTTCEFENASASCATGTCTFDRCQAVFGNCNNDLNDGCETPLNTDDNCGACGAACDVAGGQSCSGGVCSLVACPIGTADCNNDGLTCEQSLRTLSHCGACGTRCGDTQGRLPNAMGSCAGGSCVIGSCNSNYGDCDSAPSNGCESSLRTTANCGACGITCSRANASATCATGTCTIGSCNTGFASCDGNESNGCETRTNTNLACGGCNTTCERPNAVTSCSSGACAVVACDAGFGDCDGNPANGCETPLTSLTHCGACNTACALSGGTETCSSGTCTLTGCNSGYGDCDFNALNGCEAQLNTTANCNACGALCDFANGTETCASNTCTLTGCNAGFANCDGNDNNGCEQSLNTNAHCGGCNVGCTRANASASCGTGTCTLGTCNTGYGNCDGNPANGCETPLTTDAHCGACGVMCGVNDSRTCSGGVCSLVACPSGMADCDNDGITCEQSLNATSHCGGCNVTCALPNAAESCTNGTCTLGACESGFANCDGIANNGCEQSLNTTSHCGGCNVTCAFTHGNATCATGSCGLSSCDAGFGNCDGNTQNGCETSLDSLTHCGACNTACALSHGAESCSAGSCMLGACDSGFGDCDNNDSNGCEAALDTTTHCNGCNLLCDYAGASESCATGTCVFGACSSGFGDCDSNTGNGCEQALTSLTHCGGCNLSCARANAAESCATGTCVLGACDAGFNDCDGNAANGCEQALTSLTDCGGCNISCTRANAAESCATGTCVLGACDAGFSNCDGNAANGCEVAASSCGTCTDGAQNGLETGVDCGGSCNGCPWGRWAFNETSGTTATDWSGNARTGTLTSFPATPWTTGQLGGALTFDGTDDYVALPAAPATSSALTITAWISTTSSSGAGRALLSKRDNALSNIAEIFIDRVVNLDEMRFSFNVAGTWYVWETTNFNLAVNTWTHFAVSYTPGSAPVFYKNGTVVSANQTFGTGTPARAANTAQLRIGRSVAGPESPWSGKIDDLRIYDRVLSSGEIQTVRNGN